MLFSRILQVATLAAAALVVPAQAVVAGAPDVHVGVERCRAGDRDGGLPLIKEVRGLGIEQGCRAAETMGR